MSSAPDMTTPALLTVGQLEDLATMAAERAVIQAMARAPSRDEVEQIASTSASEAAKEAARETIVQFFETVGVDPTDKANLRKDFASLRSSRELKDAMVRHGLLAATGLLVAAAATSFWLMVKGGAR